jgi:hypothetical protein
MARATNVPNSLRVRFLGMVSNQSGKWIDEAGNTAQPRKHVPDRETGESKPVRGPAITECCRPKRATNPEVGHSGEHGITSRSGAVDGWQRPPAETLPRLGEKDYESRPEGHMIAMPLHA